MWNLCKVIIKRVTMGGPSAACWLSAPEIECAHEGSGGQWRLVSQANTYHCTQSRTTFTEAISNYQDHVLKKLFWISYAYQVFIFICYWKWTTRMVQFRNLAFGNSIVSLNFYDIIIFLVKVRLIWNNYEVASISDLGMH